MQILPSTGRRLARRRHEEVPHVDARDPRTNVRLGTRYFAGLLARFGDVAHRAGRLHAASRESCAGRPEKPSLPDDEFIDDIPFPETQTY